MAGRNPLNGAFDDQSKKGEYKSKPLGLRLELLGYSPSTRLANSSEKPW
jgi:hypothetical protein